MCQSVLRGFGVRRESGSKLFSRSLFQDFHQYHYRIIYITITAAAAVEWGLLMKNDQIILKAALCTIDPRSPFFAFCTPNYCRLQKINIIQLNVCFDEKASFGPFAAFIKGCSTCDRGGRNGRQPTRKYANPEDMTMFAVERHGLPEHFVSFRGLCGVQSSPLVFAPNRAIVWGPLQQWQAPVNTLCFRFALS